MKPNTIKQYLGGVRSAQVDLGFQDLEAFRHPMLDRIITGIKRIKGEKDKRERQPITKDILLSMLKTLDQTTREGANLHASFCLAFAGFLRAGEFTYTAKDKDQHTFEMWHLTRQSVVFRDDNLLLSMPSSKTDPLRRGVTLPIAASHDEACAMASLKHLFAHFPSTPNSPLFETSDKGPFTKEYLITQIKLILTNLGYQGNYSGHSFRRGAASTAKLMGLSEDEIQILGRWKSDAYRLYIDVEPNYILNASRQHQRTNPRQQTHTPLS